MEQLPSMLLGSRLFILQHNVQMYSHKTVYYYGVDQLKGRLLYRTIYSILVMISEKFLIAFSLEFCLCVVCYFLSGGSCFRASSGSIRNNNIRS